MRNLKMRCAGAGLSLAGVLAIALLSGPALARADEVYTFVVKKQEKKEKTRWSLAEWLETRDRMRLMDLWLALHSPSPYEFYLGGELRQIESSPGGRLSVFRLQAAAYASIFGLEMQRGFDPAPEWLGLFHLRIFGFHAQATNITLQAGLRSIDGVTALRGALAGVSTSLYLTRYFGIEGLYRRYFASVPHASGVSVAGNRYEGGAFIDFKFLRVFGTYFSDPSETVSEAGILPTGRTGFSLGTRLYF